jgi:hypothetical protein
MDYWPADPASALRWLAQVQRAIDRHAGDQAGALTAIINAIEYQLEIGAHVPTLVALLAALRGLAQAYGLNLNVLHLDADPQTLVQGIQPSTHPTR